MILHLLIASLLYSFFAINKLVFENIAMASRTGCYFYFEQELVAFYIAIDRR
jgi:hypothetical protein